ncbi:hypothetical protein BaRGS_00032037 [Batillaria attramentaria]|uniref:Uncharacterized protein n=1 Tax=Batillaria attramentaria TaxID=370345 RepID=A0ABD0JPE3_9CAEN
MSSETPGDEVNFYRSPMPGDRERTTCRQNQCSSCVVSAVNDVLPLVSSLTEPCRVISCLGVTLEQTRDKVERGVSWRGGGGGTKVKKWDLQLG